MNWYKKYKCAEGESCSGGETSMSPSYMIQDSIQKQKGLVPTLIKKRKKRKKG